jgi:hypothetical protein
VEAAVRAGCRASGGYFNPSEWVGIALPEPCHGPSLPCEPDPAGLYSTCRVLPCGVPEVRSGRRKLVSAGKFGSQWGRLPIHDERWKAAGKYGSVGWHTFRHTYRSWLDHTGAAMGVQQKLMRHAQISTTMNVYGNALMESKRQANTAVVSKVLRSA